MSSATTRRDRRHVGEEDFEGSWAISYGDLITVLLTFFILFFSTNRQAKNDEKLALQNALVEKLKTEFTAPKMMVNENEKSNGIEEGISSKWGGHVFRYGQKIVVEFPEVSFFKLGQTDVAPEAKKALKKFVSAYLPYMGQNSLSVKAFTDKVPVGNGKRFHDNLELSALRAISAMRDLQSFGIPLRLMRISGHGELQGVLRRLANDGQKGDPLARKIVLVVEPMTEEKL